MFYVTKTFCQLNFLSLSLDNKKVYFNSWFPHNIHCSILFRRDSFSLMYQEHSLFFIWKTSEHSLRLDQASLPLRYLIPDGVHLLSAPIASSIYINRQIYSFNALKSSLHVSISLTSYPAPCKFLESKNSILPLELVESLFNRDRYLLKITEMLEISFLQVGL